jgi:para-aminobenzoate synthetase component 1
MTKQISHTLARARKWSERSAGPGNVAIPLVEELVPRLDPWDVCRRLAPLAHLLFLDSAVSDASLGRYSFITADPFSSLIARQGRIVADGLVNCHSDPFSALDERLKRWHIETIAGLPPFQGGAAGLFGYDVCHHIERLPRPRRDEFWTPDLAVGFYDWVVTFDHHQQQAWIISTGMPETDPVRRRKRAQQRLRAVQRQLAGPGGKSGSATVSEQWADRSLTVAPLAGLHPLPGFAGVFSNFDRGGYLEAARRAIEYIHAGDCFQVNLSQRLLHRASLAPLELYSRLRERNPAPFAGFFDLGEFAIASASPERFLRVEGCQVETRPIKGTRPRGRTPQEDARLRDELQCSAKDRAENVMIIDLLRNDLGRVCAYGSVRVPTVCRLESYRTVHHLVSEVVGRLRPNRGPIDLLRAAFPGGSVTGAPKVRAMEIIAELEPTARGPYCGSLGYIGFNGSMDTSLLIRTFTMGRGWIQFPVGGGIVADSTPADEYEETLHKAEGLLRALR